jgi:hypothetical protein
MDIVRHSSFAGTHTMEKTTLGGLPVWMKIALTKKKTA